MDIKPIETRYKGYRFRSRLEARWAVFFDALEIEWEYEKEGFRWTFYEDAPERFYLPDFYLPKTKTWVEVKGDWESPDIDYFEMLVEAIDWGGKLPHVNESDGSNAGLLLLGNIPNINRSEPSRYFHDMIAHPILQHHKGVLINSAFFGTNSVLCFEDITQRIQMASSGSELQKFMKNPYCTQKMVEWTWHASFEMTLSCLFANYCEAAATAYERARSARFEHGEQG
jgi:hypothetical protein